MMLCHARRRSRKARELLAPESEPGPRPAFYLPGSTTHGQAVDAAGFWACLDALVGSPSFLCAIVFSPHSSFAEKFRACLNALGCCQHAPVRSAAVAIQRSQPVCSASCDLAPHAMALHV